MIDVGTHHLFIHTEGQGTPTVIIDVGVGSNSEEWRDLQGRLAETSQTCTYDRAGYGRSEAGPFPRDAGRVVNELRALLRGAALQGPYLLVGHSLGALLLEAGRLEEAEQVYRADLDRHADNVWSLHGLEECLRKTDREEEAREVKVRFDEVSRHADVKIKASCFCRRIKG